MNILKLALVWIVLITFTSCQSGSEQKNAVSDMKQTNADAPNINKDQKGTALDTSENIVTVDLGLAPKIYNAKVLSQPNPDSIHADWEQSELGTSWSLFATKKITNKYGVFYEGALISPRGVKMDKGPYFFMVSEWEQP